MRTRVKICGVTRVQDALEVARLGADAIGLVFHAASPRHVSVEQARGIVASLPPFLTVVGLFMNAPAEEVNRVLDEVPIDLLQFHGDESPEYCVSFPRPYIKAVPMGGGIDPLEYAAGHASAQGLLLDSHALGAAGGSGKTFDWARIPPFEKPLILAGGLGVDNVAEAVRRAKPYGVDISSGVESAKGIKDAAKMAAFIDQVNGVERD